MDRRWTGLAALGVGLILGACAPAEVTNTAFPTSASPESHRAEEAATDSATLSPGGQMVWPTLLELQPDEAAPGATVLVIGSGGYILLDGGGYNESARSFALTLDGAPIGSVQCYVNRCVGEIVVPPGTSPGEHTIATEGGSSLTLWVK